MNARQSIDLLPSTVRHGRYYAPALVRSDTRTIVAEGMPCYDDDGAAYAAAEDAYQWQQHNGGSWLRACAVVMN